MRYELSRNGVSVPEAVERAIEQKSRKVEERLKRYHPDVAELEVRLANNNGRANDYECDLRLHAFRDTLVAKKTHPELRVAVDDAFDAIMRELDTYKNKINKSVQSS